MLAVFEIPNNKSPGFWSRALSADNLRLKH